MVTVFNTTHNNAWHTDTANTTHVSYFSIAQLKAVEISLGKQHESYCRVTTKLITVDQEKFVIK